MKLYLFRKPGLLWHLHPGYGSENRYYVELTHPTLSCRSQLPHLHTLSFGQFPSTIHNTQPQILSSFWMWPGSFLFSSLDSGNLDAVGGCEDTFDQLVGSRSSTTFEVFSVPTNDLPLMHELQVALGWITIALLLDEDHKVGYAHIQGQCSASFYQAGSKTSLQSGSSSENSLHQAFLHVLQ